MKLNNFQKKLIAEIEFRSTLDSSAVRNGTGTPTLTPGGDTMYTNMANLQQTMLLQQRMFLQALCQQNSLVKTATPTNTEPSNDSKQKQFIAPSLSQYRFVSGQQVKWGNCLYQIIY